ncbi:hypothetical protein L3Y34_014445 [Caenorhabditis briggsae]|uniref:Uncharacterized protein n=1 Tax=Caenorhabditis briggsae TaxID=6238 RepID=A0AAE9IXK2_CAEBR|nr:hypothetical protein L3Y34_014445 [Caenorhabditis briggsae]
MGWRVALSFLFLLSLPHAYSQNCASARLGANDVLEAIQIYSNEYALDSDHVSYEIASTVPSNSFDQVSDSIRIMVNNQSSCPADCTVTLNRYTDSFQGAETTVLFFDTDHAFYLPSHYIKDNKTTFVCVANNGSCGATVPIYRYYKISNGGVFHAYSFDQDITYDGYNQEFLPICYAWTLPATTVASRPSCGTLTFNIPPEMLSNLNIYDNNMAGIERDHYYTTLPSTDPSLVTYNQTGVLGKVLTSAKSTACSCLVKLQQQFDNQTGYFHRLDHKLIVTGQEPNRPYEEYVDTGEVLYCSKRLGDCGATLPLWKQFQFYDIDTVYTTDSSPLPMSYLYPQTPLCYIWPVNYSPNVSTIVSGPVAPAPPVPTTTIVPSGSDSTSTATMGTIGTGSKRILDSVGLTDPSTLGSSMTTPTTSATSIISSWGTSGPTPSSSGSTSSVWATNSASTASTVSTMSTPSTPVAPGTVSSWGTSMTTNPTSLSTISVMGTNMASSVGTTMSGTSGTSGTSGMTASETTGTTASTMSGATEAMTTPSTMSTSSTGGISSTTVHLSDVGAVTPGVIIPVNISATVSSTPVIPVTAGEEVTEVNMETEAPLSEEFVQTPETFTLSNFWFTTTTPSIPNVHSTVPILQPSATTTGTAPTVSSTVLSSVTPSVSLTTGSTGVGPVSPVTANAVPNPTGIVPSVSVTETVTTSNATTELPQVMVTGPMILIIPTMPPPTTENSATVTSTQSTPASGASNTTELVSGSSNTTEPTSTLTVPVTNSHEASPATPTPQHVAQAAPTYSIVGGALDSFTNSPIIGAIISSSVAASTPAPTQSQPTQPVLNAIPSTATVSTTTQDSGIIWKAGDWISNAWHSVFGGSDQSSTATSTSSEISTTTSRPIGGLVGSLINASGGNSTNSINPISSFLSGAGNFIDQHSNSNSNQSFVNNTMSWIDNKMNSTGEFLSNAWDLFSNQTEGGVLNNTQTWIGGALNSTGNFLTNAWNTLSNSNPSGSVINKTETWIGGAVDNTGNFFSNAWNSLNSNNSTGPILNNTQTWIGGALNSTGGFLTNAWNSLGSSDNSTSGTAVNSTTLWVAGAVNSTGEFISNAWDSLSSSNNSIIDNTKTWVGGAVNSTGQFLATAWNETKEHSENFVEGAKDFINSDSEQNVTALAAAPHPNPIGSVANVIHPIVNSSTTEQPTGKIEWNGSVISGPITGQFYL